MDNEIVWIDIDDLGTDVCNMRAYEDQDIDREFWDDVKKNGINYPLLVRPAKAGQRVKYAIVHGRRRFDAALQAGLDKVPCVIKEMDDFTAMARSFTENKHRKDAPAYLHAQQIGRMYDLLKSKGMGKQEAVNRLMEATGLRESSTYEYLSICSLPKSVFELMKAPEKRSEIVRGMLLRLKRRNSAAESRVLTYNAALKVARVLGDQPDSRMFEVAAYLVDLGRESASRMVDLAKAHPETPADDLLKDAAELAAVREGRRLTINLDAETANALKEKCVRKHTHIRDLASRYVEEGVKDTKHQPSPEVKPDKSLKIPDDYLPNTVFQCFDCYKCFEIQKHTRCPFCNSDNIHESGYHKLPCRADSSAPTAKEVVAKLNQEVAEFEAKLEHSEPMQSTYQPSLSSEIITYLGSSGLSAKETKKLLSNPYWLALSDNEKKQVIDSNVKVQNEIENNANRIKKWKEEREATSREIEEKNRNDPNRNPKTADPDVIFLCLDCDVSFRVKHSDRESCPACHSTNIQYNDYAMDCRGGTCWHPRPLKDLLLICPCGCGYGFNEDDGKWYSPAEMEGKFI